MVFSFFFFFWSVGPLDTGCPNTARMVCDVKELRKFCVQNVAFANTNYTRTVDGTSTMKKGVTQDGREMGFRTLELFRFELRAFPRSPLVFPSVPSPTLISCRRARKWNSGRCLTKWFEWGVMELPSWLWSSVIETWLQHLDGGCSSHRHSKTTLFVCVKGRRVWSVRKQKILTLSYVFLLS